MRAPEAGGVALRGPVGYDVPWLLVALGCLLLVAAYVVVVLLATREPRRSRPETRRRAYLDRLDEVAEQVAAGRVTPREGHRRVSALARAWVADAGGPPATTMTLTELEEQAPGPLAELVALVYPPEFSPDDDLARARLREAVRRARALAAEGSAWS